jgi:opacity protein-like surface antigen
VKPRLNRFLRALAGKMALPCLAAVSFLPVGAHAQLAKGEFASHTLLALNFCQIDGDQASGYHKFGYSAGYLIAQGLGKGWEYQTGLLYTDRGSRRAFNPDDPSLPPMHLDYQMLDIMLYMGKAIERFKVLGGLRTGYMIKARDKEGYIQDLQGMSNKVQMLGGLGFSYAFTAGMALRLEGLYSINSIFRGTGSPNPLISTGSYHNNISLGLTIRLSSNEND